MTDAYVLHERPELESPVLVVCLHGWIDVGAGGASAMEVLETEVAEVEVATFDADRFIDYRARRPVMQLREGVNEQLVWPETKLRAGHDRNGKSVLLLTGHEPDAAWRASSRPPPRWPSTSARACSSASAPTPTPRPTPARRGCRSALPRPSWPARLPFGRNTVDVPAGVQAALERSFADKGLPAVGLWAQVPHYVSNFAYPAASVALLGGLTEVAGIELGADQLRRDAEAHRKQLDELVASNNEHVEMVRQLEVAYDAEAESWGMPGSLAPGGDLPTGDELAAELERFLRDQGS